MIRASLIVPALLMTVAVHAQTVAPVAPPPPPPPIPAQPPLQPPPPVAAPFGALYNTISGRSGAINCTPGLTPFNASRCR